ncbi:DUF2599 domain-containing protein [Nocardia stercoris]|uniref:DUF2599 domain-containing protein n=1 Tax=Nocardia stercoris TaxID=2483361 RepID=UPI001F382CBA|nr:DUF2599 domain-containing protein [Nocardia stercoris]
MDAVRRFERKGVLRVRWLRQLGACGLTVAVLALAGCATADRSEPVTVESGDTTTGSTTTVTRPARPTGDPLAGQPLIDHVEWLDDPDGRRLSIVPTQAGRTDSYGPALDRAWSEVLADAPDADTPGMYDQFRCHWDWARLVEPDKPSWNIEPWRPAVGYGATVAALCNPGGPDPAGR